MEFDEKSTGIQQLEEVSIDKVCRTCLSTSEDLIVTLYDEVEGEKIIFLDMLTSSFGKIVPSLQNLPTKLCAECQDFIRKSYEFRARCIKSTEILIGSYEQSKISLAESKETQTEPEIPFDDDDDENFEGIQLQSEDMIFEAQENPLIDIQQNISNEEIEALDENFELEEQQQQQNEAKEQNLEIHVDEEIIKCEICSKTFSRINHLKRHMLTHDDVKPLQCTTCDKRFTRLDHLNQHILSSHSESKPFHCSVEECKKGFFKKEQLKKHMEAKHSDNQVSKEICEICEKTFSSKKYLRSHMRVHGGEKNASKKDLNHERPYLCSECGLRFVRNDYLVIHMRRHLGLKPYKCKFCDKGFPRATDLTVHERYHTNEKTHLCNLCGKGFQRAYNLLVHMRVHTGEKPYQCSYCSKSFSQGNDLKAHIRRHTGERFKCDLCSEGFIQGYHLTHHKRTVHGLDVKSHIRRVEKFAAEKMEADIEKLDEPIKIENDYQQVLMN